YLLVGSTSSAVVAGVGLFVEALAVAAGVVASLALRQQTVPSELLGRVGNVFRTGIFGALPIGALLGGVVAHAFGLRVPLLLAGGCQVVLVVGAAGPLRRRLACRTIDLTTGAAAEPLAVGAPA